MKSDMTKTIQEQFTADKQRTIEHCNDWLAAGELSLDEIIEKAFISGFDSALASTRLIDEEKVKALSNVVLKEDGDAFGLVEN